MLGTRPRPQSTPRHQSPTTAIAWNRLRGTRWVPVYDRVAGFPARRRALRLLYLRPGAPVLLVGAGTGADLPIIPPRVAVTAIDLTSAMLSKDLARRDGLARQPRCRDTLSVRLHARGSRRGQAGQG